MYWKGTSNEPGHCISEEYEVSAIHVDNMGILMDLENFVYLSQGPSIKYVRRFSGFLDPLPPLVRILG